MSNCKNLSTIIKMFCCHGFQCFWTGSVVFFTCECMDSERTHAFSVPCSSSCHEHWFLRNLICGRMSIIYYNRWRVFWIRFKILMWNFKVCIISMIKLEPFKAFALISAQLAMVSYKSHLQLADMDCKYESQHCHPSSIGGGKQYIFFCIGVQMRQNSNHFYAYPLHRQHIDYA